MKTKLLQPFLLCVLLLGFSARAELNLPERPNPPRLVNDLAGVLGDTQAMEDTLQKFAMNTSNQIAVITVDDLQGEDAWYYAVQLGRKWGVGKEKYNNGVIILIKPKNETGNGKVTIQVGKGLEGALTDGFCSKIINNELIPEFKKNNYAGAVWNALKVIMPVAAGEYTEKDYDDAHDEGLYVVIMLLVMIVLFMWFKSKAGGLSGGTGMSSGSGTWGGPIIFPTGTGSSSSGSSWSGGSSGSSWGGFGGGSFGGGGASGSW